MTSQPRPRGFDATTAGLDVNSAACAGQLRVRTRYLPAKIDGGGDLYDAAETKFGLRLLIGDVMGTGVAASQTAAAVLGAWRTLADNEPTLAGAAVRLHGLISRSRNPERFVTALMVNFDGPPWAEIVCCGHPPPLLLRAGTATFVDTCQAAPPLGLLDMADGWCTPGTFRLTAADQLLLYTDGVSEARNAAGDFFPLAIHAARAAAVHNDGDALLDALLSALHAHIGDGRRGTADDILLVLVSCEA
jgi:serine phosphatase RsbU (regulator of sigma subunit)